jgi:hypothetical protein
MIAENGKVGEKLAMGLNFHPYYILAHQAAFLVFGTPCSREIQKGR